MLYDSAIWYNIFLWSSFLRLSPGSQYYHRAIVKYKIPKICQMYYRYFLHIAVFVMKATKIMEYMCSACIYTVYIISHFSEVDYSWLRHKILMHSRNIKNLFWCMNVQISSFLRCSNGLDVGLGTIHHISKNYASLWSTKEPFFW